MPRHRRQRAISCPLGGQNRPAQSTSPKLGRVLWPCLLGLACLTTLLTGGAWVTRLVPSDAQLASRTSTQAVSSSSLPLQNSVLSVIPWNTTLAQAAQVPAGQLPSDTKSSEATSQSTSHTSEPPVAEDWPRPQAVLMLSAETNGYLEPCGCSLTQSGGMSRRLDLFQRLTKRGWPVAGLDAGGFVKRSRRQDQIKYEAILTALRSLNYQVIGLGPADLRLGADFLLTQQVADPEEVQKSLAISGANVTFFESPDLGTPLRTKTFKIGEVKACVVSVLGKSRRDDVAPAGVANNITFSDPDEEIRKAIEQFKGEKPHLLILLNNGTVDEAKEFARKFPAFQLIVTTGGPEDPQSKPVMEGRSWIIQPGQKGKYVSLVGYFPDDVKTPFRYELIDLDNRRFKATKPMENLMADYQKRLELEQISLTPELVIPHPSGRKFVGSKVCGDCHTKAYEKWEETGHAKATKSIIHGRGGIEGEYISRIYDPECINCHTTGWEAQQVLRYDSGYRDLETSAHLFGNGCENCHSPGSEHVRIENGGKATEEEQAAARLAMRVTLDQAKKTTCYQCHDGDNSPGFEFDKYWKEIAHPWRD
ncbi:5'-nucleotidase/2' 3'-cyclic phosphodiesterase-like esterase [Planctopirus limnophila DSM 3776]|uniref:5'-nucleotidase/2' 3'-cyclic phosphodiesterase-like esterase n=1 Tax=Planctopirus limnophila (strain ATCC 43296 / DSM 3776 / IFAM 1008 / Mu 290) TaxID=521674 RepID=D5SPB6_PLAL2|nr:multiheme c-type cytochrome [Planctopirus limnophila]ADG68260.1 5'-nucleotidase/2' 3'-cyclic phosphodiesterase-like esterase [Planctopirus limnophila DSM 3776]